MFIFPTEVRLLSFAQVRFSLNRQNLEKLLKKHDFSAKMCQIMTFLLKRYRYNNQFCFLFQVTNMAQSKHFPLFCTFLPKNQVFLTTFPSFACWERILLGQNLKVLLLWEISIFLDIILKFCRNIPKAIYL